MKKQSLLARDISLRAITKCGRFRITAVSTRGLVNETLRRHPSLLRAGDEQQDSNDLWDPSSHVPMLGNFVSFTNLLATWMNGEERVHAQFFLPLPVSSSSKNKTSTTEQEEEEGEDDEPVTTSSMTPSFASLICESLALGETRAFVSKNPADYANVMKVQRIVYKQTEPVLSATKSPAHLVCDSSGDPSLRPPFFASSLLVPHAHFFLEQSDGIPTAAFLMTGVEPKKGGGEQDGSALIEDKVCYSAGVLLQPIASSASESEEARSEIEEYVRAKISKLEQLAAATCEAKSEEIPESPESRLLSVLHGRGKEEKLLLQDLVGLMTGDWKGAAACCSKARHVNSSDNVALVQNLSTAFWGEKLAAQFPLELDAESAERTALDFFCRCSKSNDFLNYLRGQGSVERAMEFLRDANGGEDFVEMPYSCSYCGQSNTLTKDDVEKLFVVAPESE